MDEIAQTALEGFFSELLSAQVFAAAAALFAILWGINKTLTIAYTTSGNEKLRKAMRFFRRFMPVLDLIGGILISLMPGVLPMPPDAQVGQYLIKGIWVGFVASKLHKLLNQTFLGDDKIVKDKDVKEE